MSKAVIAFLVLRCDKPATGSIHNGTNQNLVVLVCRLLNCVISKWIQLSGNVPSKAPVTSL